MSKVLTKAELVICLREQDPNLSAIAAIQLTDAFFEEIVVALEQGDVVKLSGLGSFRVKNKKARPGRNPKTGINTLIASRNVVRFQASEKLKAKLKGANTINRKPVHFGRHGAIEDTL